MEPAEWIGLGALLGLGLLFYWKSVQDRTLGERTPTGVYEREHIQWYDSAQEGPWLSWIAFKERVEEAGRHYGDEIAAFACHEKRIRCPRCGKRLIWHYMPAYTPFDRERLYLICLNCAEGVGEILLEAKVESRV